MCVIRGSARLGKCHSGNGNYPSEKCPFRELSLQGAGFWGTNRRGTVRQGNVLGELSVGEKFVGEMSVGELSRYHRKGDVMVH